MQRDIPDVISLVGALATAIPASIRQVAVTNVPAFSSIINQEFLDGKRPQWFLELPAALQSYLIARFGIPTSYTVPPPLSTIPSSAFTTLPSTATGSPSHTLMSTDTLSPGQTVPTITSTTSRPLQSQVSSSLTSSQLPTPQAEPITSPTESAGLTKSAKIAIGVGVPLGLIAIAALLLACFFLRRRRRKSVDGSIPPSSPGFIPRFAFQQNDGEDGDSHRYPIHRAMDYQGGVDHSNWDSAMNKSDLSRETSREVAAVPTMAPAICHTHSSNRARGRRTSYTSLNTVMEMSEPRDSIDAPLPAQPLSSSQPPLFIPASTTSQVKRKPVPSPPLTIPAAGLNYSNDNAVSPDNGNFVYTWPSSEMTQHPAVSPILPPVSRGTSWGDDSYIEDYGPEYDDRTVYGSGTFDASTSSSLHRLVEKEPSSDWPLKNNRNRNHHRNRSLVWDRVYHT